MKRCLVAIGGIACMFFGVVLSGGRAQEVQRDDFVFANAHGSLPVRGLGLARFPAARPLAIRPDAADNWVGGTGNWSNAAFWTAGVPNSSSAVTLGNTASGFVTEDLASASAASLSILSGNELTMGGGNTLTVGGATSVSTNGTLIVGNAGASGSTLNSGGSFTNAGNMQIGNAGLTTAAKVNVTGTFTNTGGRLTLYGGSAAAGSALLNVSGAAPGTLTGTYNVQASAGSAAVEWGSGGITQIGDGGSNLGLLYVTGSNAYVEIGATNSNSALKTLTTIASNGELEMDGGTSATTTGALTVNTNGHLYVGEYDIGGATLNTGGSLTNSGTMQIGNPALGAAATTNVTGTYTGTGTVTLYGGNTAAGDALLNISGAAPSTLTGTYNVEGSVGSAAVKWGSGGITQLGDGGSNRGWVYVTGSNAYLETGATNSNSALKTLTTIASNGQLEMDGGTSLTTNGALTVNTGGRLYVGDYDTGGAALNVSGLTNAGSIQVGNPGLTAAATVNVTGTYTGTGGTVTLYGGNTAAGNALLNITGAAPSTLTGTYNVEGSTGSAAVKWGSGGITQLGDGVSNRGFVYVTGSNGYLETGATNSNSALKTLTTIASNGELEMDGGTSVTTNGALTVNTGGQLYVGDYQSGGATLNVNGMTNAGIMQIGNNSLSAASTVNVTGTYTGTGGKVTLNGGNTAAGNALLNITGAAPGTLTGTYYVEGGTAAAAVKWGSGGITQIGDGGSNLGNVYLAGSNAYMEVGATNSNSALKGLTTIAKNGELEMDYASLLTTTSALTVNTGGQLYVGDFNSGGATLNLGGSLTNAGLMQVGNNALSAAATVNVTGTYTGTGGKVSLFGGNAAAGNALLNVSGAAPSILMGTYFVEGSTASAAVKWGSGGITQIGDGGSNAGDVYLAGSNAYMEVGATNSNSALKGLTTIAKNGVLEMDYGASLTTTGALTVNASGLLQVGDFNLGGATLNVGTALTNGGTMQIGNIVLGSAATVKTGTSFTNTGTVNVYGGNTASGDAVLEVKGPTLSNSGNINLTGATGSAELEINGNVTLSGTGKVILSNNANNIITGAVTTNTLTNSSTIQGSGSIANIGIVNKGTILANQSIPLLILPSATGLNNQGTLSVLTGETMQIGTASGGALKNFSGTTLTGGTYSVGGTLQFGASGTSVVTDAGNISLTGAGARIIDFGGNNVLTNLATIASGGSLTLGTSWGTFTTAGNFTNNGTLSVGGGDKFIVNLAHSLTNFSGTTLTGGTYKITGTLQFAGANIVTNAANITLTGANSKINGSGTTDGLANFATNAAGAGFTLGTGRSFTTAGNFTNNGSLVVGSGDTFKVNGNLTNFSGTTLTGGAYNVSGTLQFNGASIVTNAANITLGSTSAKIVNQSAANAMLGFTTNAAAGKFTLSGNASLTTNGGSFTNAGLFTVSTGSIFTVGGSGFSFTQTAGTTTVDGLLTSVGASSLNLNGGSLFGNGTVSYGVVDTGVVSPGESVAATGKLAVTGTYTQSGAGALDVTMGGTTAGTKYDQLNVSSTATLGGTLNISLASGFTPTVGSTFDILNASSISGTFSTVTGTAINGSEHFTVSTVGGNEIVLTVVAGPAAPGSVNLTQLRHPGVVHGRYGRQVYGGQRQLAPAIGPVAAPAIAVRSPQILRAGPQGFRARDEFASPVTTTAPAMNAGIGNALSLAGAPVSSPYAAMNHLRFECGVDMNALLKTSPKRLLKGLWAAPDSADAVNIGYVTLTTR
jgi:fibronectin-binding autotransporter adhesin